MTKSHKLGIFEQTFLQCERSIIHCKCFIMSPWYSPFLPLRERGNNQKCVQLFTPPELIQGCVCPTYILILVNLLILIGQLINRASQLIVQIVLWLCAGELFYSMFLCVQSRWKLHNWEADIDETVYSFTLCHLDCAYWDKTFVLNWVSLVRLLSAFSSSGAGLYL